MCSGTGMAPKQGKTPAVCVVMVGRGERRRFSGRDSVGCGSQRSWIGCQRRQEEHSRKQVFSKPQQSVKSEQKMPRREELRCGSQSVAQTPGSPSAGLGGLCAPGEESRIWSLSFWV